MRGLELVVVLGVAVLLCSLLARRFGVTPPVLLFGCGVLLGFIPALRRARLPPEAMLFLFLPAPLYWESLTTRWGDPGPGPASCKPEKNSRMKRSGSGTSWAASA
jgi:NhaP-type Na+/H+ or K+/H+ antiporter